MEPPDAYNEEARGVLASFSIAPSIIVSSGHGLHAYWLLRELEEPERLSNLAHAVATALGADHAFDAARLLRLPGTMNRKDPTAPISVLIEAFDPDRRYNVSEIEDALAMAGSEPEPPGELASRAAAQPENDSEPELRINPEAYGPIWENVFTRVESDRRLRGLFEGVGKPEFAGDGRRLDRTSSGYDFARARDVSAWLHARRDREHALEPAG